MHAQEVRVDTLQALIPTTPIPGSAHTPSDINGDGFSDLVWTNPFKHQVGYWIMGLNSSGEVERKSSVVLDMGAGNFVGAVGDFNGDGFADMVLTNADRDLVLWTNNLSGKFVASSLAPYSSGWQLLGAGDVDGDGQDDLLWFNKGGCQFGYWLIKKGVRAGIRTIPVACGYSPVAIGYFSPNPRISIVWTSSAHDLWIWDSMGAGFRSYNVTQTATSNVLIGFGGGVAGQGISAIYRQNFPDGSYSTFVTYMTLGRTFDTSGHQTAFTWSSPTTESVGLPWSVGGSIISGRAPQGGALIEQQGNGSMDVCMPQASSPPQSGDCASYSFPRDWFMVGAPGNGAGPRGEELTP